MRMNKKIAQYLRTIEQVIENGKYKDTWESLHNYPEPGWYQNAKFGIFIHWGVYSVPAFGSEWYPRNMYIQGSKEYNHHLATYGPHKNFGYADFIPMFTAEHFNAQEWIALFKASGAKYIMPVAEHHDGFQMYDSALSDWNAARMGPKRDIFRELKDASAGQDLVFCASSHRAENYWFFAGGRDFDSGIQDIIRQEPYGYACQDFAKEMGFTHDISSTPPSQEHLDEWLARTCEIVDQYQPKIIWFDWWIHNKAFKPYLKKFAAYYYNRALEWGEEVAINYKYDAFPYGTAIFDIERGQLANIRPKLWQTDTAIAKNAWGYTTSNDFKDPVDIVCDLIDIVSKNGCMLLNIGPKPDGTITAEEKSILLRIGEWLAINGEAIYNTSYWKTFGEGITNVAEGAFKDGARAAFTSQDIRFTYHAPFLYAHVLRWPKDNVVQITSLKSASDKYNGLFNGAVEAVEILGYTNTIEFQRNEQGLIVKAEGDIDTPYPVCLKITIG
jgi:alpha-L-fucosidase